MVSNIVYTCICLFNVFIYLFICLFIWLFCLLVYTFIYSYYFMYFMYMLYRHISEILCLVPFALSKTSLPGIAFGCCNPWTSLSASSMACADRLDGCRNPIPGSAPRPSSNWKQRPAESLSIQSSGECRCTAQIDPEVGNQRKKQKTTVVAVVGPDVCKIGPTWYTSYSCTSTYFTRPARPSHPPAPRTTSRWNWMWCPPVMVVGL